MSFPIAFDHARIHGVETKLEIPRLGPLFGLPELLESSRHRISAGRGRAVPGRRRSGAIGATGSFPISQDQRNTAHARLRYQVPRVWLLIGGNYGSGLPVDFQGDPAIALAQYGQRIFDQVNFSAGRVRPSFSIDASVGIDVWKREKKQ